MSTKPSDSGNPADAGVKPVLMPKDTTTQIGLNDLLSVISMIVEHGQIDPLRSSAEKAEAMVVVKAETAQIGLHDLLSVISKAIEHGQVDALRSIAKQTQASVIVPAETANLVKTFVAEHSEMSVHTLGQKIVGQPGRDPADGGCTGFTAA